MTEPPTPCTECGGAGYYTTEGSPQACMEAGCIVLHNNEDGTCQIVCMRCGGNKVEPSSV